MKVRTCDLSERSAIVMAKNDCAGTNGSFCLLFKRRRVLFSVPLPINAWCSHDSIDRENDEQDHFVKSVQIPFLKECLRRETQHPY